MPSEQPEVVVLGGINGSGMTTASQKLLAGQLALKSFVNADIIARGLNGFQLESVAADAGVIMIERIRKLADERADFAVETTLAGRTSRSFGSCAATVTASSCTTSGSPPRRPRSNEFGTGWRMADTTFRRQRFGSGTPGACETFGPSIGALRICGRCTITEARPLG